MKRPEKKHHRYSGPNSKKFWNRVGALTGHDKHSMYTAGVLLQEMESKILQWLEVAESAPKDHQEEEG